MDVAGAGAVWSEQLRTPLVPPLVRGTLGTAAEDGVAPELTVHAPITFCPETGDPVRPPQLVGFVHTLDGTVLLDGDPPR